MAGLEAIVVIHDPEEILPVIRQAMKDVRLSQRELAVHLGVTTVHLNRILNGKSGVSVPMLFEILSHLDIRIALNPPQAEP